MVIDFHSHILPGIDDGSNNLAMSVQMLEMAAMQKVDIICATPHFYSEQISMEGFLRKRLQAYDKIRPAAEKLELPVILAAEVAYFPHIEDSTGIEQLCYRGTNLLLLEMPFRNWNERDIRAVSRLSHRGIRPVIAHLERFLPLQYDPQIVKALLELPVLIQINAGALLHWRGRRRLMNMFFGGTAHLLGSDCHNLTSRPPNLREARVVLQKKFGKEFLNRMDYLGMEALGR